MNLDIDLFISVMYFRATFIYFPQVSFSYNNDYHIDLLYYKIVLNFLCCQSLLLHYSQY